MGPIALSIAARHSTDNSSHLNDLSFMMPQTAEIPFFERCLESKTNSCLMEQRARTRNCYNEGAGRWWSMHASAS